MNTQDYYKCFNQCLQNLENTVKKKGKRAKAKIDNSEPKEVCKEWQTQTLSVTEYIKNNYPFYYIVECEKAGDVLYHNLFPDNSGAIFVFRSLGRIQTVLGPECINKYRIFKIFPKTLRLSPNDVYEVELPYGWDILVNYIKIDKIVFSRLDIMGDIEVFEPDATESMLREQLYLDGYTHSKIKYDGNLDVTLFGSYLKDTKYKSWDNSYKLKNHVMSILDSGWSFYKPNESVNLSTARDYVDYYGVYLQEGAVRIEWMINMRPSSLLSALDNESLLEIGNKYVRLMISAIEKPIRKCQANKKEIREFLSTCYEERLNFNRDNIPEWIDSFDSVVDKIYTFARIIEIYSLPHKIDIDYKSELESLRKLLPTLTDLEGITPEKVGFWRKVFGI